MLCLLIKRAENVTNRKITNRYTTRVTVTVNPDNTVVVKGPKGELSQDVHGDMIVKVEGAHVIVERPSEDKAHKAMHGLYRALIHNMVVGVSEGYTIKQELVGVGYRANAEGQVLELGLGYSHGIFMVLPNEVKVSVLMKNVLTRLSRWKVATNN